MVSPSSTRAPQKVVVGQEIELMPRQRPVKHSPPAAEIDGTSSIAANAPTARPQILRRISCPPALWPNTVDPVVLDHAASNGVVEEQFFE